MAEQLFSIDRLQAKDTLATAKLEVGLTDAHLGRLHMGQAIDMLRDPQLHLHSEDGIKVAEVLVASGQSLAPIHDIYADPVLDQHDSHGGRAIQWRRARLDALAGDYDAVVARAPSSLFPVDNYTYAAGVQVSRGQDPSPLLSIAEQAVDSYSTPDTRVSGGHPVIDYGTIGRIYAQEGDAENARRLLSKAEGMIDTANDGDHEEHEQGFHDNDCDFLASSYTEVAMFDDALRVLDKIRRSSPHHFVSGIKRVVEAQLKMGLIDDAVNTSLIAGGPLYLKTLSDKVAHDAQEGLPFEEEAKYLDEAVTRTDWRYKYEDEVHVRIQLASAAFRGGDHVKAEAQFASIYAIIEDDDPAFRPDLYLAVAQAVDDLGFDASAQFSQTFQALKDMIPADVESQWRENGPEADLKWICWGETIEAAADRGYMDHAREGLDGYIDAQHYKGRKAQLLAYVGRAEIKRGFTEEQISNLTDNDIRAVAGGSNSQAKAALEYFGRAA